MAAGRAWRVLVTGGAGFIGSAFVRRLLLRDPERSVVVLDKLTYAGNRANLAPVEDAPGFRFVEGDIADPDIVDELAAQADAIVNFAAESHVDRSIEAPDAFIRTDVYGTYVLLEAARRHQHAAYLQVSTDEVYGEVPEGSAREEDPAAPRSPYAASKAAGDLLAHAYHVTYGVNTRVTRGSNTYGPYQFPEKIIPLFATNAIDRQELPLYGDGLQAVLPGTGGSLHRPGGRRGGWHVQHRRRERDHQPRVDASHSGRARSAGDPGALGSGPARS